MTTVETLTLIAALIGAVSGIGAVLLARRPIRVDQATLACAQAHLLDIIATTRREVGGLRDDVARTRGNLGINREDQ